MRNIVIALSCLLVLIWLFISKIYVLGDSEIISIDNFQNKPSLKTKEVLTLDVKRVASLLKVNFVEDVQDKIEVQEVKLLDIELNLVVIYTSMNESKLRVDKKIDGKSTQIDMKLGDKLYDYSLISISPSFAVFSNGENDIKLQAFKSAVISVSQTPKEVSEQL